MGVHTWAYLVPYENLYDALEKLAEREFLAGRYHPAASWLPTFRTADTPGPGAQHATIEEARVAADGDGTRSILDVEMVMWGTTDLFVMTPLEKETVLKLYGTTQPTREMVLADRNMRYLNGLGRGESVCLVLYADGKPAEYLFAGLSVD